MGLKILLVYLLGILLCQPVYIWGIRILCRMEDEDEELYCQDNGMYYEPSKPNYPLLLVVLLMAGIFWPLVIFVCGVRSVDIFADGQDGTVASER